MMKKENAMWSVGYVVIFLAIQVIAMSLVQAIWAVVSGDRASSISAECTIVSLVVFSLLSIALFTWAGWSPVSRRWIMTRPWSVLAWSVVAALGVIVPSWAVQDVLPEWPAAIQEYVDEAEKEAALLMSTTGGYAVVCLLAPVAEELVFRGAVLRTLLAWKPERRWLMIVLSALLFALAHLNPAQLLHPFAIGLLLGWMYERTGSVVPGIVFHWANNTVAYLLFHAYPSPDISLVDIFGQQSRVLMAVAFSLLILLPAIYQLNHHLNKGR
jgi:hypothetical protein